MSYNGSYSSFDIYIGPPPFGVPLTLPWVDPHSIYAVSPSVGPYKKKNPSHTYGVDSICNAPVPSTVSDDTPVSSAHIFHSNKDILESMTSSDYPWDDMHYSSDFLLQDA